jgi:hypothetical protein
MQESFSLNRVGVSPLASSPGVGVVVVSLSHQRGKKIPNSNGIQFQSHQRKKRESGDSFVNVYLRLKLTCHLLSASCCFRLYCRSREWVLHWPSPTGFVHLEFSWMHAPFVFSSIQSYPPVAIAVLFYFEFAWGGAAPSLSCEVCHTLVAVGCILLSKHTWGGGATPTFSGQLV